jgi:hypothetical protein
LKRISSLGNLGAFFVPWSIFVENTGSFFQQHSLGGIGAIPSGTLPRRSFMPAGHDAPNSGYEPERRSPRSHGALTGTMPARHPSADAPYKYRPQFLMRTKSRVNSAGVYTKPALRKRLFQRIKSGTKGGKAGQWSAIKAMRLATAYKKAGGGYRT